MCTGRLQATPTKWPKQVIDQSDQIAFVGGGGGGGGGGICVRTELKSYGICSCFHF